MQTIYRKMDLTGNPNYSNYFRVININIYSLLLIIINLTAKIQIKDAGFLFEHPLEKL